jgi:Uma2 family endonuclease
MATVVEARTFGNPNYPTTDGKPMAETDDHRILMYEQIETLDWWFADQDDVYVSGNLLLFHERGNKRRHISPDVFVVKGVPKGRRLNYILWEERKPPRVVIELTSSSTRHQDTHRKYLRYRDNLKVREYFLFDPHGDYLDPRLQGHRLRGGAYHPIRPVEGRLPSLELGLHLEQHGDELRLYDPVRGAWLPTPRERAARAEAAADAARLRAERLAAQLRQLGIEPEA